MLQKAVAAIITSPSFESKLQAIMDKVGNVIVNRLGEVEKTVKEQGEKIARVETKSLEHDEQFRGVDEKTQTLERELGVLRDQFNTFQTDKSKEIASLHLQVSALTKCGSSSPSLFPLRPSPLETCPDPSNLKEDFRSLLAVKKKNKAQIVLGPVLSKTPGDGFLDKDELEELSEDEVAHAIRKLRVEGEFTVTITNAEKRMARVRFDGFNAEAACSKILTSWKQLRDEFRMWASPDQPVDLSKMIVNAKRFGIALRGDGNLPATSYVDVHDGVLFIGAIRIAPVYLIPEKDKWPLINSIVVSQVKNYLALPWTVRKVRGSSPDMVKQIWDAAWKDTSV